MDIITTYNPPRMVVLAGEVFWVRALTQEDWALIVAWLDDVLPKEEGRTLPPRLSDDASQKALESPTGWTVLAWSALRHVGIGYERACQLIGEASDIEKMRLATVLFRKRPTYQRVGHGDDIGEAWWGPSASSLSRENGLSLNQIGAMTLDQMEILISDGIEQERPGRMTLNDVQAMWEERQGKQADSIPDNGDPL